MPKVDISDRKALKLLSIFHYIFGGVVTATSFLNLIFISIGLATIFSSQPPPKADKFEFPFDLPSNELTWMFFLGGSVNLLLGLTLAACLIISAWFLAQRKRYWFSFIVACIECADVPLGTVLGIFTIIVLSQNSVKALYGLNHQH